MQHVDKARLIAWLDDAIDDGERTAIEAHLASCESCRAWVEEERSFREPKAR